MMTLGKRRRLDQAAGPRGTFTVLAIDHRGPLRRRLGREIASAHLDSALAALKQDIVRALAAEATAVLLDPEIGLEACIDAGVLAGAAGLLVALDTGSTGDPAVLRTGLVEGWDPARVVRSGAAGAKLLVYYHPDAPDAAKVEELVRTVAGACVEQDLPLYLEPLAYDPVQPGKPLSSAERRRVATQTAARLGPLGADVLKVEFPVNVVEEPDEAAWRDACRELDAACPVPWALLSAGASFETFLRQTRVACEAGSSGAIAGRALWNEAVTADLTARGAFLARVGCERMRRLRCLTEALGRPWTERVNS